MSRETGQMPSPHIDVREVTDTAVGTGTSASPSIMLGRGSHMPLMVAQRRYFNIKTRTHLEYYLLERTPKGAACVARSVGRA